MNQELGLRILSQIMAWTDDRAREEFAWLRLMARLKYDGYRDFQAGMRFIESLATWLQQFKPAERETAYDFVRRTLVYIGPSEMQRLVEQFYPRTVSDRLAHTIATRRTMPKYRMLADATARAEVDRLRRKTLFMALSDGARIDTVRHANVGLLTNEQLVVSTQPDTDKWQELLQSLRNDLQDPGARFALVYLIDDFMGTGTSFIRFNDEKNKWSGKLIRFKDSVASVVKDLEGDHVFETGWRLCVHHYVGSDAARRDVVKREAKARPTMGDGWATEVHFSFGTVLPPDLKIDAEPESQRAFIELTRIYYDPILRTRHTDIGGVEHQGLGYGGCALPIVLDHNTPNNSVALLWAETDGGARDGGVTAPAMRPLFRRRRRHA